MSQRVKKSGKVDDNNGKRRRRRPSGSEVEEEGTRSGSNSGANNCSFPTLGGMWTPRHLNDLKVSSIYNRNSAEAPAELYRKDLISAMKLADSEPLTPEEYWLITDPWKQEWEKGVQVPVNPESLPEPEVVVISPVNERSHDFRLPKKKYIRVTHDDFFSPDYHQLVSTAARAEKVCSYDLDDIDASWLSCANADRGMQNSPVISEFLMEQVIEELELQCWEQVQTILKSQEGLGIEYDENVICDVCRSPESEEGNEMVFCDACNICVHQACYGITTIPSGSWLCRTCTLGIRPSCVLCPNMGGAMKATRSGQKWAHVACAIWIPEVSIGSVEKMEPITKISAIPQSRWSLICVLCKDKDGACIQCSVKTCKTAYHVTCAFKHGLEMKPIIVDENAEDGIKLRSYCQKHSVNPKKDKSANSGSEEDTEKKKARAMTAEERNQARAEKLQQIESEFYKYVRLKDVAQNLAVDMDIVMLVYNYWKLKRKSSNNRPLVPPRPETTQLLTQQQEQDLEQMKMFVQLRQDLERVRNLCYMVSRREKLSRSYFRLREQAFQKQVAILSEKSADALTSEEKSAIMAANHGPSIYDQLYSHEISTNAMKDYDTLVTLIAGEDRKDKLLNGVIKPKKSGAVGNSLKKQYVNGARKKNLIGVCSSLSESEGSASEATGSLKKKGIAGRKPLSYLFESDFSADGADNTSKKTSKTKAAVRRRQKSGKSSTSDSDDLELPLSKALGSTTGKADAPIYSDSETDASTKRRSSSPLATKAAVKQFAKKGNKNDSQLGAKGQGTVLPNQKSTKGRKKKNLPSTDLIVPQREAAKKAAESIKSVKQKKDGGDTASLSDIPNASGVATEREGESFEKTFEKFKDIAAASVQERQKKKNDKTKIVGSKQRRPTKSARTENRGDAEDPRDLYEFDGSNDSKNVPSFVPQRQAAKKAAEHIRSGLSNVVAARLIIEDEMEAATRRKTKQKAKGKRSTEGSPVPSVGSGTGKKAKSPFNDRLSDTGDKPRARKRTLSKEDRGPGKGGRKESSQSLSADVSASDRPDWPFLDRGSQSACRRSRERSSSSSSSSSSGSSSSDSSSDSRSSASSSPASASPESIATPRQTSPVNKSYSTSSTFPATSSRRPGRKLKTSDRSPDSGPRNEIIAGKKPPPKGRGPGKSGPGRSSTGTAYPHSARRHSTSEHSDGDYSRSRKQKISTSSSSSSDRRSSSPPRVNQKLAEKKGKRGERKSPGGNQKEKTLASKLERSSPSKSPARAQARVTAETLGADLHLSSDSEQEEPARLSPDKQNSNEARRLKKDVTNLSDSEPEQADEKENSCRTSALPPNESPSRTKTPKSGVPVGPSVLSPLATTDNKEKESHSSSRVCDSEPDAKRARWDENSGEPTTQVPIGPSSGPSLFSATTGAPILSAKSLFSPRTGHENDLVDFDSELYDLARSVSADYSQIDEEGGPAASSVPFFQSFLGREDMVEDSPQATLNLVEKLRLQHARKSGCPRSSVDSAEENIQKSPTSARLNHDGVAESSKTASDGPEKGIDGAVPSVISPERSKLAQGDERWVPPSTTVETFSETGESAKVTFHKAPAPSEVINNHGIFYENRLKSKDEQLPEAGQRPPVEAQKVGEAPSSGPSQLPGPLTVNTTSPPGVKLPQPGLYPQGQPNFPPGSHPSFMYPPHIPGGSAPNVAVPVGPNSPRTSYFRSQAAPPPTGPSVPASSLSPGYPRQSFPGPQHFVHSQPPKESPISPQSLALNQQRRTATGQFLDENAISGSISSGMPHLAKPSIASPSMILAANNVKNITPAPPPQSTVAQIIENVVNNHANNSSLVAQELNVMLGLAAALQAETEGTTVAKMGATIEMSVPDDVEKRESSPVPVPGEEGKLLQGEVTPGKSPRGRGRRAAIPRASAAAKAEKVTPPVNETNGVKPGRGRGERKPSVTTSPARAKAAGPGRGRGKGRNKSFVPTRKDLAGTVYDIDFDEFEENVDGKVDLRMLRERRKSSDHHQESKSCKSERSGSPTDHHLNSLEVSSPKLREVENTRSIVPHKILQPFQNTMANENTVPELNSSLTTVPMDMRTYNASTNNALETSDNNRSKFDPMKSYDLGSNVARAIYHQANNVDELNEGAFPSPKFPKVFGTPKHISGNIESSIPRPNVESIDMNPTVITRDSNIDGTDPSYSTDLSRNQLKVKIKGPFLDANYGSHSIGDTNNVQHFPSSLHPVGPTQIVSVPATATSNLRRMRKKELLRQYWNQDMNMDGTSGPSHDVEMPHNSMVHRSVITIPKAVASMAIIPTKDDYRESLPNEDPLTPNTPGHSGNGNNKPSNTEKRKRNRGIREMAALGIITCDTPRERRRERADPNLSGAGFPNEVGKKRGKATKRPIRSTFIPPTLVDSDHSNTSDKKTPGSKSINDASSMNNPTSAVVTAVNHPTPKLKIKFGDLSKGGTPTASVTTNHLSDSSDKEAPNKKAKGRPPKKRGISEIPVAAPPSMEELKRESMKFREKVMQDFVGQERKEILQLQGTRRKKKHKRKGGGPVGEGTDPATPGPSPASEVKIISEGSKLILRFGSGRKDESKPIKEEGESGGGGGGLIKEEMDMGENDSGFTGSSEGSSGSMNELSSSSGATKESSIGGMTDRSSNNNSSSNVAMMNPSSDPPPPRMNNIVEPPREGKIVSDPVKEQSAQEIKKEEGGEGGGGGGRNCNNFSADKIMPIRLKLSRCFEGYALTQKQESCGSGDGVGVGVVHPPPPAKQSDSCEVR